MDLKWQIKGSDEIREKLHQKLLKDPNFVLVIDLDKIKEEIL